MVISARCRGLQPPRVSSSACSFNQDHSKLLEPVELKTKKNPTHTQSALLEAPASKYSRTELKQVIMAEYQAHLNGPLLVAGLSALPFFFFFITGYNFASNFGLSTSPCASTFASRYVWESCSNMQTGTGLGIKGLIRNIRVLNSAVKLLRAPLPLFQPGTACCISFSCEYNYVCIILTLHHH